MRHRARRPALAAGCQATMPNCGHRFEPYEFHYKVPDLSMIRSRIRSGMANAKAKGKQIGRRPTTKADLPAVFIKYYPAYANGSMNVTELARICGLSRPTVYKYIKMVG